MTWLVYYKYKLKLNKKYPLHYNKFNDVINNEINNESIHGIYDNYKNGLIEFINYNIKNNYNYALINKYLKDDEIMNINKKTTEELEYLHSKIIKYLHKLKNIYKYCDIVK